MGRGIIMPIGIIINSLSVLIGGLIGAILKNKLPKRLCTSLPLIFGLSSLAMGINSLIKMNTLSAIILSIVIGTAIGELIRLESLIEKGVRKIQIYFQTFFKNKDNSNSKKNSLESEADFIEQFISIVILFCASGTGIYGSLVEGITGDHSILITKSILDFFTAAIFAASLGFLVAMIFIPQFFISILLFFAAAFIMPFTDASMIADFTACGGLIMMGAGFRISGIKSFPIANMLPALILIMPVSHLFSMFM